jgi:hypothetical protein
MMVLKVDIELEVRTYVDNKSEPCTRQLGNAVEDKWDRASLPDGPAGKILSSPPMLEYDLYNKTIGNH